MKKNRVPLILLGSWLLALILIIAVFGWSRVDNTAFQPQDEFKLETWINLPGPFDINKGVLYIVLAGLLTVGTWIYIANRMHARPNRTQTAVETLYGLMRNNIAYGNMERRMATKWFTFVATLFLFIWYSNLFANILAGHLIILFMAGGLVVLLGIEGLGVLTLPFGFAIYLFEVGLVATLQAFIFATLTAIYLGEATAEHH
jgi:F0F1-type ATP synthase membrane subunit a